MDEARFVLQNGLLETGFDLREPLGGIHIRSLWVTDPRDQLCEFQLLYLIIR